MDIAIKLKLIKYVVNKDVEKIEQLFKNNKMDCEEVIAFFRYHKMDLFLYELIKNNKYFKENYKEFMETMELELELFKYRKKMHKREYQSIFEGFQQKSVKYMVLKGFGLDFSIFEGRTVRKYSDIDFWVCPSDLDMASEVCESLSYIQGYYYFGKKEIVPYSRKEKMSKRLYSHELAQFVKVLEDGFVSNIDINFKFSWTGYKGIFESMIEFDDAFEHSQEITEDGIRVRVMDSYYNCIHLCCHFFNSCVNFLIDYEYELGSDPREFDFSGINDVYEIIKKKGFDFIHFKKLVEKFNVQEQVDYVFHLITVFFGVSIPHFCYNSDLSSLEEINYYITRTGKKRFWKIPFLTRIFDEKEKTKCVRELGFED